jgi:hypothetical protein
MHLARSEVNTLVTTWWPTGYRDTGNPRFWEAYFLNSPGESRMPYPRRVAASFRYISHPAELTTKTNHHLTLYGNTPKA